MFRLFRKIRFDLSIFFMFLLIGILLFGSIVGMIDSLSNEGCKYEHPMDYIPTRALVCEYVRNK